MSRPRENDRLESHARRLEGRRLIQACLDGEIDESSPRLRQLLASDATLRDELHGFREMESLLRKRPESPDLSAGILESLQDRPVFLPAQRHGRSNGLRIGLAACLALGAGSLLLMVARVKETPSATQLATTHPSDLVTEARNAIRDITGQARAHAQPIVIAPGTDAGDKYEPVHANLAAADAGDPRLMASQMVGADKVRIERAGLSFVNPGPGRGSPAAMMYLGAQPDAMYSGSKFQRSDMVRSSSETRK